MARYTPIIFATLCMTLAANAWADPTVTFNGVDITGLQNQKFNNVTIEFDAKGNIILTAPQYKLVNATPQTNVPPTPTSPAQIAPSAPYQAVAHPTQPAAAPTAPAAAPTVPAAAPTAANLPVVPDKAQPTYLIAIFDSPGLLGYNVDVYINGAFIKTLEQGKAQQTIELSKHLIKGKNTLQYRLILAADSGTSSKATVAISLAKMTNKRGNAIELSGQYADIYIKGADGAKTYTVDFNFQ